jgi:hypothetical protein
MKTILALLVLISLTIETGASELPRKFINALHQAETGGRLGAIKGDGGSALGPFQIHESYWHDSKVTGHYEQVTNYTYSVKVVTAYLNRYGSQHINKRNWFALARIHNGGPDGMKKPATIPYAKKVMDYMKN